MAQSQLRVALFVEGSQSPLPPRQTRSSLEQIWNEHLPKALGLRAFSTVIPISKKHLVAMDPKNPAMSGAGEALDALMVRTAARTPFEAAVVAWDLVPAWNVEAGYCRWQETLDLYNHLSQRDILPTPWRRQAGVRLQELQSRAEPSARHHLPRLIPYQILPLCMDPMFETLLVQDEAAVKRALGLSGKVPLWPSSWGGEGELRPDEKILAPSILAARAQRTEVTKRVLGTMRTNKDGWGEFLLRTFLAESPELIRSHPIARRLTEIGPR